MSNFSAKLHEARHELTTQLIHNLLGLELEDENFTLAHDFCLQKEYYHSYGDVNPSAVETFYAELVQRLREDSQLSKAAALSALTSQLLAQDLQCSVTLDLNHNLLQLLASLAGQPLNSELEQTPQLLALLYKPAEAQTLEEQTQQQPKQAVAVSRFRQLLKCSPDSPVTYESSSRASSEVGDYDPYGEDSDLENWKSDDEQDSKPLTAATTAANVQPVEAGAGAVHAEGAAVAISSSHQARLAPATYLPPGMLPAPQQLQPCRATPASSDLLVKLSSKRLAHLPFLRPDMNYCFTEQYLAQQLIRVLHGQQAHGFILAEASKAFGNLKVGPDGMLQSCFKPDPRVTTPVLSPGALHALMAEIAAAGSAARELRQLAAQLTQTRGQAWVPARAAAAAHAHEICVAGGIPVTSCLRAFGVALQQQLDLMGQQLIQLQQQISGISSNHSGRGQSTRLCLLSVKQQARPIMRRLHLLHSTVSGLLQQLGCCPADASATLLDGLYEAVSAAAVAGSGDQGVADAAALLHLLLCSCVPMVASLARWLWSAADEANASSLQLAADNLAGRAGDAQQVQQSQGVSCCSDDFFILKKAAVAATDAQFWHTAYGLCRRRAVTGNTGGNDSNYGATSCGSESGPSAGSSSSEGMVACPAFLLPLLDSIMAAGKSVRLLDYMEQEELRHTSFCSNTAASSYAAGAGINWLGAASTPATIAGSTLQLSHSSSSSVWLGATHQRPSSAAVQQRGVRPSSSGFSRRASARSARVSSTGMGTTTGAPDAAAPDAAAAAPGHVTGRARKQWGDGAAATHTMTGIGQLPGQAIADVTKQVRLQLAVAAAVACRSEQDQLAPDFVNAACRLLQQKVQNSILHASHAVLPPASLDSNECSTASDLMRTMLEAAGKQLAQPSISIHDNCSKQKHATAFPHCLREALVAVRQQRTCSAQLVSKTAHVAEQHQTPATQLQQALHSTEQQPGQQQQQCKAEADQQPTINHGSLQDGINTDSCVAPQAPEEEQAATAADADADSVPDVPRLLQWRDQLEGRLAVAGGCLQNMAPWQHQRYQKHQRSNCVSASCDAVLQPVGDQDGEAAACSSSVVLGNPSPGSSMPGSFSASLAELWPLQQPPGTHQPATATILQWGACSGSSDADGQVLELQRQQNRLAWLAASQWPTEQLAWLLLDPPRQLLPLPQLLEQALLQPLQERIDLVGHQLLSSLMGEWGLLQQLQSLVGVFLLASPTMVEWCEGCFSAVEATAAAARRKLRAAGSSSTAETAAALPAGCGVVLGMEDVDVYELELLLHDLVSYAAAADALPDPSCLHVSLNTAALRDLRTAKQKQQGAAAATSTADAGEAAQGSYAASGMPKMPGPSVTGGLWACAAEWAGLTCRHSGTWQLSLLYNPDELDRFSLAWRFLLQLRWVRRRLDSVRHAACKGAAAKRNMDAQDSKEQAAVLAAMQAASRDMLHARAPVDAGQPKWLSSRQELLLLQEMGQLMARWQQYVMDRLIRGAVPALEQALYDAGSLDDVRSAAGCFLCTVSNLCNARPSGKGAGGTWRHVGKVLGQLMDSCLAAAATATQATDIRQQLAQPGLSAAVANQRWLDLHSLRTTLSSIAATWRNDCGYLLRILTVRTVSLGDEDDLEALLGALDANGYFQKLAKINTSTRTC